MASMARAKREKAVGEKGRRVMIVLRERDCRFKVSSARREINAAYLDEQNRTKRKSTSSELKCTCE